MTREAIAAGLYDPAAEMTAARAFAILQHLDHWLARRAGINYVTNTPKGRRVLDYTRALKLRRQS